MFCKISFQETGEKWKVELKTFCESTFKDYALNIYEEKPRDCTENSNCEILHQQTLFRRGQMSQCTEYTLLFIITIRFPPTIPISEIFWSISQGTQWKITFIFNKLSDGLTLWDSDPKGNEMIQQIENLVSSTFTAFRYFNPLCLGRNKQDQSVFSYLQC